MVSVWFRRAPLADRLRITLKVDGRLLVPLAEELAHTETTLPSKSAGSASACRCSNSSRPSEAGHPEQRWRRRNAALRQAINPPAGPPPGAARRRSVP